MRHRVKGKKLSRTSAHRSATMRALASALIQEHRIVTTVIKAKELRKFVEPLITRAKEDNHHNRTQVFASLQNKHAVTKLFDEVAPKAGDRPGGYTRVIKVGFRNGDGADTAVIELVDYNDIQPEGKTTKKKKTRRAGKSAKQVVPATELKQEEKSADVTPSVENSSIPEIENKESDSTEESK